MFPTIEVKAWMYVVGALGLALVIYISYTQGIFKGIAIEKSGK